MNRKARQHVGPSLNTAGTPPHTVISNGAGRLFPPHSLPRMRRPAQRDLCIIPRILRDEISLPLLLAHTSYLKPASPSVTIHAHGAHLPSLLHGQQIRSPLSGRDQQPVSPRRPAQRKNPSRLHPKVQRYQTRLVRAPHEHSLGYPAPPHCSVPAARVSSPFSVEDSHANRCGRELVHRWNYLRNYFL